MSNHHDHPHPAHFYGNGKVVKTRRAGCSNGLYVAPTEGQQVDTSKPLTVSWDNTCMDPAPQKVDIYLNAPLSNSPEIHYWTDVDYAKGTVDLELRPKWWNSTSTITLQLNIVKANTPSFLTDFGAAPKFVAKYDATAASATGVPAAADTSVPDEPYTTVNNSYKPGGLSKGSLAAAVLIPLLVVGVALGVYVKFSRAKEAEKRKRWSAKVDARMSTISVDWKSITPTGANAAIRHSMAMSQNGSAGNRNTQTSSFFAGNGPRPSSTFDGGQAGIGAKWGNGIATEDPHMVQIPRPRGSTIGNNPQARVSRVSFAADPRPSLAAERHSIYDRSSMFTTNSVNTPTRPYHRSENASDDEAVPPLPPMSAYYANQHGNAASDEIQLSPTQTHGPYTLTPDQIRARLGEEEGRPSVDGELLKMPALTLMRTTNASNDYVVTPTSATNLINDGYVVPSPITPSIDTPTASDVSTRSRATSQYMPALNEPTAMSPDAMLAAYAAKKKPSKKGSLSGATATASANGGMRVLYAPQSSSSLDEEDPYGGMDGASSTAGSRLTVIGDKNPFRTSMAVSGRGVSGAYSDTSRYSGVDPAVGRAE
ncbi:hypothetical protein FRC03_012340 [Tulasnella sp. 419]|nr:hypothetical protein FRC03_012340 [Tulasnella sp. 419]